MSQTSSCPDQSEGSDQLGGEAPGEAPAKGGEPTEESEADTLECTLRQEFETEELARIVERSLKGGITSDIPSNYSISVDGRELSVWMRADTKKKLQKMRHSYLDSIRLILETVSRFTLGEAQEQP